MISKIIDKNGELNLYVLLSVLIFFLAFFIAASLLFASSFVKYIAVLVPVSIILFYLTLEKTEIVLLLYISAIPFIQHFSVIGVGFNGFIFTPHMMIQLVILLTVYTKFLYTYDLSSKKILTLLDRFIILFLLSTFFSLIFSYYFPIDHEKSWLLFYTGVFEPITFYFIVLFFIKREEGFLEKLILALVLTSIFSAAIAILELRQFGFNLVDIFLNRMRIGFGYHNTNLFGIQSVIIFPISFFVLVSKDYYKYRYVTWPSFIILIILSMICFNRGTIFVFGVQLFLLFLMKENRKVIYLILSVFVLFMIYFNELIMLYLYRFLGGAFTDEANILLDKSALYRFAAWETGVKILFNYPVGVGPGGFQHVWEILGAYPVIYLGTPHHLLLSIGVDYGVPALILFIIILSLALYYSNSLAKNDNSSQISLFKYIRISIIGFILYGLITDGELSHLSGFTWPNNGYTLLLIILLAIISNGYRLLKKKHE